MFSGAIVWIFFYFYKPKHRNEGINGLFSPSNLPCPVQCAWIFHYKIISIELKN